jgi:hypothetical protein
MTQYSHLHTATMLKKAFRLPIPALNIYRHNEDVACDIVYSDVPAIFCQFYCHCCFCRDFYNQFANTLEDNIIQRGAPNHLLSDRGQATMSNKV